MPPPPPPPHEQPLATTYLVVCEADVPGEQDHQPITTELDLDAFGQFLQRGEVTGGEVVGQSDVELLLVRLHADFWRVATLGQPL